MCKYVRGEFVWGYLPFDDNTGVKIRPLLILNVKPECKYFVVACFSYQNDKHNKHKGIVIEESHPDFKDCGFVNSTYINCQVKAWLPERLLKPHPVHGSNPIGKCNFMDEVDKLC